MDDFIKSCPLDAHISSFNFKGKEQEVVSAKGYNLIAASSTGKGSIPGTLSLVWNAMGEAYSREMAQKESTNFREMNRVIVFDGQVYQRNKVFDLLKDQKK